MYIALFSVKTVYKQTPPDDKPGVGAAFPCAWSLEGSVVGLCMKYFRSGAFSY